MPLPLSSDPRCEEWPPLLNLPLAPSKLEGPVKAWREGVEILTFSPEAPDVHPMFLERRVYQGSSGKVYPLPFCDRISTEPELRKWDAIHLENEYIRVMVLPQIGGRIHVGFDKRTGYDFFYRQNVIRPALVGLAGPWISGGVEFNWPQHHRPATFMPTHSEIELHSDGSVTVWCSDNDPLQRMKGMHGVCLHPGCARIDLKVRLYNRTPFTQTFLWWANLATRVHGKYQSFFPSDVAFVADHAKRAVTAFPLSDRPYYGVDYPTRAKLGVPPVETPRHFVPDGSYPANDLSWYSNIPVPTSYMVTHTEGDFFGGYDHAFDAGVVHVADHHIVPGKKQWTWGNHDFGYAWDRNLTLNDGPYIELMAGAYTDNQPDFSYLSPWETKSFTQSWFPISEIGIPHAANRDAALRMETVDNTLSLGIQVTTSIPDATVVFRDAGQEILRQSVSLTVEQPFKTEETIPGAHARALSVEVLSNESTVIDYDPASIPSTAVPVPATEPELPENINSVEDLYLTGLHLEQYRHATRAPEPYWREALLRDPNHSDSLNALGLWHLHRGEFELAVDHFQRAIARLTLRNPNPRDGEAFYNLGLAKRYLGQTKEAYGAFYKATWNSAWKCAAFYALAEIDCIRGNWEKAIEHLDLSLVADSHNLNARNLRVYALLKLGRISESEAECKTITGIDPLDLQTRWRREERTFTGQEILDLAFDLMRSGQLESAERVLESASDQSNDGSWVMIQFTLAHVRKVQGKSGEDARSAATMASLDYCFPSRLEEQVILQSELDTAPSSPRAKYLLGLLWYDKKRYMEAIELWNAAAGAKPDFPIVWRNLGIARFNIEANPIGALDAFDRAYLIDPRAGRTVYERDQLWKRVGRSAAERLEELRRNFLTVQQRDDLSVEFSTLLNQLGRPQEALAFILSRTFQPWEGGEGLALEQYVRARVLLGRQELARDRLDRALHHLEAASNVPESLNEAKHLLANWSHVDYWLGLAHARSGNAKEAARFWTHAASHRGDFQQMAVMSVSSMTYWTGMAQIQMGQREKAAETFEHIRLYAEELDASEPKIDYFATSLPAMLLFKEDLAQRNHINALFLRAQASLGMARTQNGDEIGAISLLKDVLLLDPNHADASDLLAEATEGATVRSCNNI